MPPRSPKMKRRILGFQRRVWWPKWTPASSSSRIETTDTGSAPFWLVSVVLRRAGRNRAHGDGTPASAGRRVEGTRTAGVYPIGARSDPGATALAPARARPRGRPEAATRRRPPPPVSGCANRSRCACRNWRSSPRSPLTPYCGSPGHGKVDRSEVHADLVRAPGLERDVEERVLRQGLHDLEVRHRLARLVGVERAPRRIAPVAADRRLDPSRAGARMPADEREVAALDLAPPDRLLERGVRRLGRERRRGARTCPGRAGGRCPGARDRPARGAEREELRGERAAPLPAPGCTVIPAGLSTTTRCSSS